MMKKTSILLFWLLVWQMFSLLFQNHLLLVGPIDTLNALCTLLFSQNFFASIWFSFARISGGFFLALFTGILTASLSYWKPLIRDFLEPPIQLMKSIPVASFVILALIWTGSEHLSVLISFLVSYPMFYVSVLSGLTNTDVKLLEMARVFHVPVWNQALFLYRVSLYPYLESTMKTALAMAFKSGIAAEVIGVPEGSIGEGLYLSKIYLSTAELFACLSQCILANRYDSILDDVKEKVYTRDLFQRD